MELYHVGCRIEKRIMEIDSRYRNNLIQDMKQRILDVIPTTKDCDIQIRYVYEYFGYKDQQLASNHPQVLYETVTAHIKVETL